MALCAKNTNTSRSGQDQAFIAGDASAPLLHSVHSERGAKALLSRSNMPTSPVLSVVLENIFYAQRGDKVWY